MSTEAATAQVRVMLKEMLTATRILNDGVVWAKVRGQDHGDLSLRAHSVGRCYQSAVSVFTKAPVVTEHTVNEVRRHFEEFQRVLARP